MLSAALLFTGIVISLHSTPVIDAQARSAAGGEVAELVAHEAWLELSIRLETTPVASRDAEWELLAEQAAVGVLSSLEQRGEAFGGAMLAEAFLGKFPTLKTSAAFMNKREKLRRALVKAGMPLQR